MPGASGRATRAAAAALLVIVGTAAPAGAQAVAVEATIDEAPVERTTGDRPARLDPEQPAVVRVVVANDTDEDVVVRAVRLEGRVMGLPFYAYETAVGMEIEAGDTDEREFELDLAGLRGQAVGLVPSRLVLLGADREEVAAQAFVADVRGSLRSVYGLFGLGALAATAYLGGAALLDLARRRLPANRWRRALRFATPGLGLGLVLTFTLSALRVAVPTAGVWAPLVLGCGAALFGAGYLTPGPDDDETDDDGAPLAGAVREGSVV